MAGWFRKKITTIDDYKGLKVRMGSNLARKVVTKAGATAVLTPAADIYSALERGVIDAAEWVGPYDDVKLGLHQTASRYYYPGWQDTGTMNEFSFNKKAYEALPVDFQRMLDHAAAAVQVYGLAHYHTKNAVALERLRTEFKGKVEILPIPASVLRDLGKLSTQVLKEESDRTPMAREGTHVVHQVPGFGWTVGPRRRRGLPPARGGVTSRPRRFSPAWHLRDRQGEHRWNDADSS